MKVHQAIEVLDDQGLEYEVDSGKYDQNLNHYKFLKFIHHPGSRVKDGRLFFKK